MSFKKNKFSVVKNAIGKELAHFLHEYLQLKKQAYLSMREIKYISDFNQDYGGMADSQCSNTFCLYSPVTTDVVLALLTPIMKKETGLNLCPTYSYSRVYERNAILMKHTDRPSCEVSTTINLGGDLWPIYIKDKKGKEHEIKLEPGDMLVYSGCELYHWREQFTGNLCTQLFLHYNDTSKKGWEENKFDGRKHLGLPHQFKKYDIINK
tara:strand:- start:805 stop:1431 length:627 start_codon:yes stop_codon:yes gene_type:complete